jgi:hypothetical protein
MCFSITWLNLIIFDKLFSPKNLLLRSSRYVHRIAGSQGGRRRDIPFQPMKNKLRNKMRKCCRGDPPHTHESVVTKYINRYKYLRIILSACGIFKEASNVLYNNALNVCFKLYKDLISMDPLIKTLLHLFDHIVKSTVLYWGEIWGLLTTDTIKKELEIHDYIFKHWEDEKLLRLNSVNIY